MSPRSLAWKPFRDRRVQRSSAPLLAVELYLARVRERCDLPAVVLARGADVLAGSGCDLADLATKGASVVGGDLDLDLGDEDLFAHAVTIGHEKCILVSRGGRVDRVRAVEADLARILA